MCVFVGGCLITEVFVGNLPATGRGWVIIKEASGQLPTNQFYDINWGALNHGSHAPQLMSMTHVHVHIICICMCMCTTSMSNQITFL